MLKTFLKPTCNYNVFVLTGPPGTGKTYYVSELLSTHPNLQIEWVDDIRRMKVSQYSLQNKTIIKIIDSADNLKIPKEILKHPVKYIIIANNSYNLPKWCNSKKVMRTSMGPPSPKELLTYAQTTNPAIKTVPESIMDYRTLDTWIVSNCLLESSSTAPHSEPSVQCLIEEWTAGENPDIGSLPMFYIDTILNGTIGNEQGIQTISNVDFMKKSGLSKELFIQNLRFVVKQTGKVSRYKGVFIPRKVSKKPEKEFETGKIKSSSTHRARKPMGEGSKTLFDF